MGFDPIKLATNIWEKPGWVDYLFPVSATKNILAGEGDTMDYIDAVSTFLPWGFASKLARGGIKGLSAGNRGLSFGSGGANMFGDKSIGKAIGYAGKNNTKTLDTFVDTDTPEVPVFRDKETPKSNSLKDMGETAYQRTRYSQGQTTSQRASNDLWERMSHFVTLKDLEDTTPVRLRLDETGKLVEDNGANSIRPIRGALVNRANEPSNVLVQRKNSTPLDLIFNMVRASETKPKRGRYRKGYQSFDKSTLPTGAKIPDKLREDYAQDAREFLFKREQAGQTTTIMDIYQHLSRQWDTERKSWMEGNASLDKTKLDIDGEVIPVYEAIKDYGSLPTNAGKTFPMYDQLGSSLPDRPKFYWKNSEETRRLGRQGSATDVSDPFNTPVASRMVGDSIGSDSEENVAIRLGIASQNRVRRQTGIAPPETMISERSSGISSPTFFANQVKPGYLPDETYTPQGFTVSSDNAFSRNNRLELAKADNASREILEEGIPYPEEMRINLYADELMNDPNWLAERMGLSLSGKRPNPNEIAAFASRASTYDLARVVAEQKITRSIYDTIENAETGRMLAKEEKERVSEMLSRPKGAVWNYGFIGPRTKNAGPIDAVEALGAQRATAGGRLRILGGWQDGALDHPAAAMSRGAVKAGGEVQVIMPWKDASLPPGYASTEQFVIGMPRRGKDLLAWLEGSHPATKNRGPVKAYQDADHMRKMLTLALGVEGYNNAISGLRKALRSGDKDSENIISQMLQFAVQEAAMVTGGTGNSPLRGLILDSAIKQGDTGSRAIGLANRLGIPVHNRYPNPVADYTPTYRGDLLFRSESQRIAYEQKLLRNRSVPAAKQQLRSELGQKYGFMDFEVRKRNPS